MERSEVLKEVAKVELRYQKAIRIPRELLLQKYVKAYNEVVNTLLGYTKTILQEGETDYEPVTEKDNESYALMLSSAADVVKRGLLDLKPYCPKRLNEDSTYEEFLLKSFEDAISIAWDKADAIISSWKSEAQIQKEEEEKKAKAEKEKAEREARIAAAKASAEKAKTEKKEAKTEDVKAVEEA